MEKKKFYQDYRKITHQKIISFDVKKCSLLTRPLIAPLITTISRDGKINGAPMSSVGFGSYNPPRITLAAYPFGKTYKNILETKEFVINITPRIMINQVFLCGKRFVGEVDKLNKAGLKTFPSEKVKPPRIQNCLAWIECRLIEIFKSKTLSDRPLLYCEPVSASVNVNCLKADGNINYKNFNVLLSLGLSNFTSISTVIHPTTMKDKEMSWEEYMIYTGHKKRGHNGF